MIREDAGECTVRPSSPPTTDRNKILVFRSSNVYQTARALDYLRAKCPAAEITLFSPPQQMEYLSGHSHIDRLRIYDNAKRGAWKGAVGLILELRKERFDEVVVLCPAPFKVSHLSEVILFSLFIPAERRMLIDGRLREADLSLVQQTRAVIDSMIVVLLSVIAKLGTHLLLALLPPPDEGDGALRRSGKPARVAILVPVLPDISHTFVYREVLAMQQHGAGFDVIALEEGDYGVLHPEAKELLKTARFVPKVSFSRYLLYYLSYLLCSPRRMAQLIQSYLPYSQGDKLFFLRFEHFHSFLHPMQSLSLARLLKQRGIGYIHAYGATYPATRAMAAASLLRVPFSVSTFVDFDRTSEFRMIVEKLNKARFVVATTDYCTSRLIAMTTEAFRHKIHTILLGIDPDYGINRMQHPVQAGPVIVSVGRFVEKKGFDYLLKSVALLKQRGLCPKCIIIGDGPERPRLHAMVKALDLGDCVTFTGALPNDEVLEYFGSENILVAPSIYARDGERDGIPTVLMEALLCDMPVVSTWISGIPELIENGLNGILVPPRDEGALAEAIQELLEHPGLRKEYGYRGREKVRAVFNVRHSSLKLWSLIKRNSAGSTSAGHGAPDARR